MPGEPDCVGDRAIWKAERAIVLQMLRDDHVDRWSRAELAGEVLDLGPAIAELALARLECEGVVRREGLHVSASRATRYLDSLELVGI